MGDHKNQRFPQLSLISTERIWDRGQHNAFTDLCQFRDQFWLVFREATNHVSDDGVIIILAGDGKHWRLITSLSQPGIDLRDPKITVTPDQQLLITCAGVMCELDGRPHQSFLYYSNDGQHWAPPKAVGQLGDWIWRTRFFGDDGYGVAYLPHCESTTLYKLSGKQYRPLVEPFFSKASHGLGYPNEHDLFTVDDTNMGCLLRRDADTASAQLGIAAPPFTEWQWWDLGIRVGGPVAVPLRLTSGGSAILCAVRLYDPARTVLCWLDTEGKALCEALTLPSAGDNSYAGILQTGDKIYCSYYSSHEGKASIYLAEVMMH